MVRTVSELDRGFSNLKMKIEHELGGLQRKRDSLLFFEILKKRKVDARIQELNEALDIIEDIHKKNGEEK